MVIATRTGQFISDADHAVWEWAPSERTRPSKLTEGSNKGVVMSDEPPLTMPSYKPRKEKSPRTSHPASKNKSRARKQEVGV